MVRTSALLYSRWLFVLALLTLLGAQPVRAQQDDEEKAVNLSNCLSRKNLHKCKKGWLTPQDLLRVDEIERQENQRICLTGKTPDKCDRALLSLRDIQQTIVAERRENLKNCLLGPGGDRRPCRREWLGEAEMKRVEATGKLPPEARQAASERPAEPVQAVQPVQPVVAQPSSPQQVQQPLRPERLGGTVTTLPAKGPVLPAPTVTAPAPQPVFIDVPPQAAAPAARKEPAKVADKPADKAAEKAARLRAAKAAAAASASREARAARSKAAPVAAAAATAPREADSPYAHCNAEQFIETISSEGRVAELEDGSLWIIALQDTEKVLSWDLPAHVVACPTELINAENNQSVRARRQE